MREILFKAKRIDNGEWVEGFLIKDLHEEEWYIGFLFGGGAHDTDVVQINSETICQYTGLTDKNGNKIWENDVVVYDNSPYSIYCEPHTGQIVHRNGCLCYKFLLYGSVTYKSFLSDDFFEIKCKVIGNIFDNPELVKEGTE